MNPYNHNWPELAQAYVDRHKHEEGWIEEMILYYTNPAHRCRLHEYTTLVLNVLLAEKALRR